MAEVTEEDLRVARELVRDCPVVFGNPQLAVDRIASALANEREKAAKIAEYHIKNRRSIGDDMEYGNDSACRAIAAAIRAGDKE